LNGRARDYTAALEVRVPLKIKQDHSQVPEIIRGRIKENLRKIHPEGRR